jgi:hypothetical protein
MWTIVDFRQIVVDQLRNRLVISEEVLDGFPERK